MFVAFASAFDLVLCLKNGASEARQPVRKRRKDSLWSRVGNGFIVIHACPQGCGITLNRYAWGSCRRERASQRRTVSRVRQGPARSAALYLYLEHLRKTSQKKTGSHRENRFSLIHSYRAPGMDCGSRVIIKATFSPTGAIFELPDKCD